MSLNKRACALTSRLGFANLPRQVHALLVLRLIFFFGRSLAFPYLALYMTGDRVQGGLSIDPSFVGLMVMLGSFSSILAFLITGILCDKYGKRKMLLLFAVTQIVLTVSYGFATFFPEFLLLYVMTEMFGALRDPAYNALIADLVEASKREEVYGLSYMIANIAFMLAPPIGGIIASSSGYPSLFLYAAAVLATCPVVIFLFIKGSSSTRDGYATASSQFTGIFNDRLFLLFCLLGSMTNFIESQLYFSGLLSVYIEGIGLPPYAFGTLVSVNGALCLTLQILIRKATIRIGGLRTLVMAQLLFAIGFFCLMCAKDFFQILIAIVVLTIGEIAFSPTRLSFIADIAPRDMIGRYVAFSSLFCALGASVGALSSFWLYSILSNKELTWGVLGLIGLVTLPGYAYLDRVNRRELEGGRQAI